MWWFPLCLGLAGTLGVQTSFHIASVERRGLPPYEPEDRVYCLDGGRDRGLQVGDHLLVKRAGEVVALGRLRVTLVQPGRAEGRFEPHASTYPMKGDLALLEELKRLPGFLPPAFDPMPMPPSPDSAPEAPPREGVLFFLPQRADLSPAGVKKVEAWVQAWGPGGRWAIQVPTAKGVKPALQKQRAESLQAALRALGIGSVAVETGPRTTEGRYDPAWIRHWD